MSDNNITPPIESESTPRPKHRSVAASTLLASFLTYLVAGIIIGLSGGGWDTAFYFGCVNIFISLPFTLLAIFLYRKTKLSRRWELLAAIVAGLAGIGLVGVLIL